MIDLSIVIPNYNHAAYLPDCLDAILEQHHPGIEILIIDDASTDASREIIEKYQQKYPFLRVELKSQNRGVIDSVNAALKLIRGRFVAFCAADDLVLPHFFQKAVSFLDQYPDLGLCCGDPCRFEDRHPYRFSRISLLRGSVPSCIDPQALMKILARTSFWIPSHSSIYRTEAVRRFGFDPELKHLCDWFLNYQIASEYRIGYIPFPFCALRIVKESYGMRMHRKKELRVQAFDRLIKRVQESGLEKVFLKSGLFGQLGVAMIEYLARRPALWKFLPSAVKKKGMYFLNKTTNSWFYSRPMSLDELSKGPHGSKI